MKRDRDIDPLIDQDLRAFKEMTARGLPSIKDTEQALCAPPEGGTIMETWQRLRRHPRTLTGLCAAAVGAVLLIMPISYQRTVGHTVRITLGEGVPRDRAQLAPLVRRLRRALHADGMQVMADEQGVTLSARVSSRSRAEVERRADAVVRGLAQEHVRAQAQVSPRTEPVSGRVYAMALEKVIEVRVDTSGKSAAQIEAEIRDQLRDQGVSDAQVQVQQSGTETRVEIGAEVGDRTMQVVRETQGGPPLLELRMGDIDTGRAPGMTDAELQAKIEAQLRARGLSATVTVHGDQVRIRAEKREQVP